MDLFLICESIGGRMILRAGSGLLDLKKNLSELGQYCKALNSLLHTAQMRIHQGNGTWSIRMCENIFRPTPLCSNPGWSKLGTPDCQTVNACHLTADKILVFPTDKNWLVSLYSSPAIKFELFWSVLWVKWPNWPIELCRVCHNLKQYM